MDDRELASLFAGYGYLPTIVDHSDAIDAHLAGAMQWAVHEIRRIQAAARSGKPLFKPRWPMIILRTPKGLGCPKEVHGNLLEGSFRSHQVPLPNAKVESVELQLLQDWLSSYKPKQLFPDGRPNEAILRIVPTPSKCLGQNESTFNSHSPLNLPDWQDSALERGIEASCLKTAGEFLDEVNVKNPHKFRIFSPDEAISNKLDAVFRHTGRNFQWDQYSAGKGGQIIEVLSEHTCEGRFSTYKSDIM